MTQEMVFWLCFYGFFMVAATMVGYHKNNLIAGVLLGYVLGPIGLMLMIMSKDRRHGACPHCSAKVDLHAYYCPRCENKCYKQLV